MKKTLLKLSAILCIGVMMLNMFGLTLSVGVSAKDLPMTFASGFESLFYAEKKLTTLPKTYEATIKVPTRGDDQYWGDILAANNDKSGYDGIVWDLQDNSNKVEVRFLAMKRTGTAKSLTLRFPAALESYRGKDVHLAVVIDTANSKVSLYIDGQKWTGTVTDATEAEFVALYNQLDVNALPYFTLGGDFREDIPKKDTDVVGKDWFSVWGVDNYRFFRGSIYDACIFSDARTANEVLADYSEVSKTADNLMALYDTSDVNDKGIMKDQSGNGYDMKGKSIWFSERSDIGNYAFSFAVVGDTQVVARDESVESAGTYDFDFKGNFKKIYNYIVDNKDEKKIKFSFHMGDVTDWNNASEWNTAMTAINKMNGLIPYNIVRGNHDGSDRFIENYTLANFQANVLNGEEYGTFDDNTLNTYQTLTVGEVKYLMLALDMGPCKAVIDWANEVVESHPEHNVIISTHSYLHRSGVYMDAPLDCSATQYNPGGYYNGGGYKENGAFVNWDFRLQKYKDGGEDYLYQDASYMWNNLVKKHENICMVLCGHECSDLILKVDAVGDHGNKIVQLLIDTQDVDRRMQRAGLGHAGMVAMLYFSEDGKTVSTEYYSTIKEKYFMTENMYTFELDLVGDKDNGNDNGGTQNGQNNNQNGNNVNTDGAIDAKPQDNKVTTPVSKKEEEDEGGCGSVMSVGTVGAVALTALGACFVPKSKRKKK